MRIPSSLRVLGAALALSLGAMGQAHAAADYVQNAPGVGTATANARVDFRVTVRQVLFLGIGTGATQPISAAADNGTVDLIEFDITPGVNATTGTSVAATALSGDLGGGAVNVRLFGNGGDITFQATPDAAGLIGQGNPLNIIDYTEITTTSAGGFFPAPQLTNTGVAPYTIGANASTGVVDLTDVWTYSFDNSVVFSNDVYNGKVTYTASLP